MWDGFYQKGLQIFSECYLHIINRNHCSTLLLINLQKTRTCPKHCTDVGVCTMQTGFCLVLNVYFNDVQIKRWLYLSSSIYGIPLRCDLFRKRMNSKNFQFIGKKLKCISCSMVCKIIFFPNSQIFRIRLAESQEEEGELRQLQSILRFTQAQ